LRRVGVGQLQALDPAVFLAHQNQPFVSPANLISIEQLDVASKGIARRVRRVPAHGLVMPQTQKY